MKLLGERINLFDNSDDKTVKHFNELFYLNQLEGYDNSALVEILEPHTNSFCRTLVINGKQIQHFFDNYIVRDITQFQYILCINNELQTFRTISCLYKKYGIQSSNLQSFLKRNNAILKKHVYNFKYD